MSAILKTIYVAARDLGMDDDTRRHLQLRVVGKASLKDMTEAERALVLDEMKVLGFKPSAGRAPRRRAATRGDVRFCHVLWGKLVAAGVVQVPGAAGLNAFVRARFEKAWGAVPLDIDQMRDWKQIAAVIEALKAMLDRNKVAY